MINQGFYSATPTKLSLNGPYMSFTTPPPGISGDPGDTVNLVGVATAGFIGAGATTVNDGNVVYRWYEVGVGALSDGNRLSGTNTNTLTISNLQSPGDSDRQFYLEAKYQSTAYENRSGGKNGNHITPAISNPALAEVRPLPTASITASSTSIPYNGSVTISWSTTDADTLSSNFGDTRLNATTTFSNQTSSRTFSINAINSAGSAPASVSVSVAAAPPPPPPSPSAPFLNFAASTSTNIPYNGSVSFSLTTFDADSLSSNFGYSKSGLGGAVFNDSFTISNITQTQDYILTANGPGGSTPKTIPINVSAPPPSIVITSQPSSVSATFNKCAGGKDSVKFSVGASVNNQTGETLKYQWYLNGSALSNNADLVSGAQSSELTLRVLENQSGNNTVYVIVSYGEASPVQSNQVSYSVSVTEPAPTLSITLQPTNQTVFVGETATFSVGASISNYNRTPAYQWYKNGSAISGATSSSLSITPSSAGSDNYYVIVSDSSTTCTSVPSSIPSDIVSLTASVPQKIIRVASRGDGSTSISNYQDINLSATTFGSGGNWEVYSPFEDIQVDMKIEAGAGSNKGSFLGGRGGQAIVRFTLRRNTEYIIRSLSGSSNGGGGATFIYEKARLIACVGGGGGAGTGGNGGAGGGVGSPGQSGSGAGAGGGGTKGASSLGYFPGGDNYCDSAASSSIFGGLVSSCTIGDFACSSPGFWRTGYSPCSDYGFRTALNISGQNVSNTASISRGFKGGIGHRNNGGFAQTSDDGAGGSGCEGGRAALPGSRAGGGGGNGYNGGVSIVNGFNRTGGRSGSTRGQFTIALPGQLSL